MNVKAAAMEKLRSSASASNPFAVVAEPEQPEETPNILDLFGNMWILSIAFMFIFYINIYFWYICIAFCVFFWFMLSIFRRIFNCDILADFLSFVFHVCQIISIFSRMSWIMKNPFILQE